MQKRDSPTSEGKGGTRQLLHRLVGATNVQQELL
jgi:hypothetical protein